MAQRIAVMNLGVLQQVGTFDEIYNHPVNEFVAGFIGEPPMNILPTRPVQEEGTLWLAALDGGFRLPLPDALRVKVERSNAQIIDLGVRPIHIGVLDPSSDAADALPAIVQTFESLGEEGQLAAQLGGSTVLVVTSPLLQLERGDPIKLRFRPDRVHLFDAATQQAL